MSTGTPQRTERVWLALEGMAGAIWVLVILFVTLLALRGDVSAETIGLALIIPVLVAALSGRAVALGMAFACALLFNVFFIPPYYSLTIGSSEGVTAFVVYVAVALAVAVIAGRLRHAREGEERRLRRRLELLAVAERLLRGDEPGTVLTDRLGPLTDALGLQATIELTDRAPVVTTPAGLDAAALGAAHAAQQRELVLEGGGRVRFAGARGIDADQAATLDELARLLAATARVASAAAVASSEPTFWDVG